MAKYWRKKMWKAPKPGRVPGPAKPYTMTVMEIVETWRTCTSKTPNGNEMMFIMKIAKELHVLEKEYEG